MYLWLNCRNWLILIVVTIYYKSGILFCNFVSLPKSHSFFYLFVINLYYPICIPLSIPISVPHVGFYEDCFTKITEVKLEGPESYPPLNWSAVLLLINIAKDEYSWLLWLLHYDQSFCMGEWNGIWKLGRHTLCSSDSVFCNDGAPPYYSFWWKPYKSLSQSENNDILAFDIFFLLPYTQDELSRESSRKDQELLSLTQQVESHVQKIDSLHEELNEANSQLSGLSNSFMVSAFTALSVCYSVNK